LWTSIPTYTAIFFFTSILSVGLNAAITYSRVRAHSLSRSRSLPIHTPDRHWSARTRAYQPQRTQHLRRLETFHPFTHTNYPKRRRTTFQFATTASA
jgi:hypothetical protein